MCAHSILYTSGHKGSQFKEMVVVGGVTAFPGTPLGTIRESSSSWGSQGSTEVPASPPTCKGDEESAVFGGCPVSNDHPLDQGTPLHRGQRAEGASQLSSSPEGKTKEAEVPSSPQLPVDSASEVAESIALLSDVDLQGFDSPASVISEVVSEAGSAVQAASPAHASGELFPHRVQQFCG